MTQTRDKKVTKADHNGSQRVNLTSELGVPLGRRWSNFYDDFLPELRGSRAVKHYREMTDNDATIGALLFAVEMLIRQVDWNVEPAGDTPQDEEAAAFLKSNMTDMSHSWPDFIASVLTFLSYGWSFHEIVYKLRQGTNPGSFISSTGKLQQKPKSRFDDGRIGWSKFAYQPQEVLQEWKQDEHGGIEAFLWTAAGAKGFIPIEKGLLFRTTTARGPNGRSALRNAFRNYQFKKRAEEILMIGIDRDLNGLPVFSIPADMILDNDTFFDEAKKLVTNIRKDEQWGAVIPLEYDDTGNRMWEFDVLRSDGASSIAATKDVISQLSQAISDVVLAGFIHLGRDAVGSRALAEPKQQLFQKALQGWVDGISEVLNRHAVPRLFALNNFSLEALPRFVPEEVEDVALDDLGKFVSATAQGGMDWGFLNEEDPITNQFRQIAGFDSAPTDGLSKRVEFDPVRRVYKVKR